MGGRTIWSLVAIAVVPSLAPSGACAAAEQLKGNRFLEVMQNNTLSGTTAGGAAYNLYFLPGGEVTWDEAGGETERGRWSMDPDGDVCISFAKVDDGDQRCYRVEVDGSKVTWDGKAGSGQATLRGGVSESFLQPK
jgi:hypothetical protein